ncbi:S8/S53 family peptidase [Leucobacter sp. NPDC058333]|uniref:S8/S53 family peptidase n=1 Tax=Leucobacter sp. NPDC058333 TaxID=3346450 RepID=UPI003647F34E
MKHLLRTLTAAACAAAILGSGAAAAVAAPLPPDQRAAGLWHADMWDLDALQASGATGEGVKIAVIDTFINPDVPELQGANVKVRGTTCVDPATGEPKEIVSDDPALAAHGTNVVSMLVGNGKAGDGGAGARGIAPKAEVWFYGVGDLDKTDRDNCTLQDPTLEPGGIDLVRDISWSGESVLPNPDGLGDATALAARAAIRDGADVVSVSVLSGGGTYWSQVVFEGLVHEVPIVAGAVNPDTGFSLVGGPWALNGVFSVTAIDDAGEILKSSKTGDKVRAGENLAFAAPGSGLLGAGSPDGWGPSMIYGTSYATPLTAGAAALGFQKYPDASRFQVMQAMMRTTGAGDPHEIEWADDGLGAGYLNPSAMLAVDPSQFPDTNPQWVTSVDDQRCVYPDSGKAGNVEEDGLWSCSWAVDPFPPDYDAYKAVYVGGAPVEFAEVKEETPYSKESVRTDEQLSEDRASGVGFTPLTFTLIAGGGLVLLAGIAAAIVIPVMNSRKQRAPRSPQAQHPENH